MEFFDYFTQMDTRESMFFWGTMLVAFLLGFFIAYLIRSARVSRVKQDLRAAEQRYHDAEVELNAARVKSDQFTKQVDTMTRERADMQEQVQRLEGDKKRMYNEVYRINTELEQLQTTNKTYAATNDDLTRQLRELQTQNQQLSLAQTAAPVAAYSADQMATAGLSTQAEERLAAFEQKLRQLEMEHNRLEQEIAVLRDQQVRYAPERETLVSTAETAPVNSTTPAENIDERQQFAPDQSVAPAETMEERAHFAATENITPAETTAPADMEYRAGTEYRADAQPNFVYQEPTPVVTPPKEAIDRRIITEDRPQDDLTRIDGVGPFIARKLNEVGVYTYEDISGWDQARIQQVTAQIGYLPGRIERDNWVGQAAALARMKQPAGEQGINEYDDRAAYAPQQPALHESPIDRYGPGRERNYDPTDLKIIEGVDERVEDVLKSSGVRSWADLAGRDVSDLRAMLSQADDGLHHHDPRTWPLQARLASEGRWDELRQYQEELHGGLEP